MAGMTDLTLEILREELAPIRASITTVQANIATVQADVAAVQADVAAVQASVATLEANVATLQADVAAMRPNVEGIPLIQRAVSVIQQEQRMMKAAINDLARTQFTTGEVEALHTDVNAVQSTHMELETRVLVLERQVKELRDRQR
jgi:chromosome segregation ATPase